MHSARLTHINREDRAKKATGNRALAFTALLLCGGFFALAAYLTPNPPQAGYGTHTQLHLPPCIFREMTGLPCPSCGLTTSMAYMARLEVGKAFSAHPFGCAGFAIIALIGILSVYSLVSGAPFGRIMGRIFGFKILFCLALLFLLSWGFNLLATVSSR